MNGGRKEKVLLEKLGRIAPRMVKAAGQAGNKAKAVEIFILGDAEMRRIKKEFLPREKGPANVLSFAEPEGWPRPEGGPARLGEIYLNRDLTGLKMEKMVPLLLHGVLHLLGYDHKKKDDRIMMENLEKKIINKISKF